MEQEEQWHILCASVFENSIIADGISKHLDFTDLKTFRQLNKNCYQASSTNWCKASCVRLQSSGATGRTIGEFNNFILQSYESAENFETSSFPFKSLGLEGCSELTEELKVFVSQCYRHIHYLEISNFSFPSDGAEDYFKTFWTLTGHVESLRFNFTEQRDVFFGKAYGDSPAFPKLKRLHLNLRERTKLDFLKKFPNLKGLKVSDASRTRHEWRQALYFRLTMTQMSKKRQSVLALTSLDIIGTGIESHHKQLVEANFPLKHLAFNIPSLDKTNFDLKGILDHYGGNLVTLRLSRGTQMKVAPLQLLSLNTQFEKLIDLELWGNLGNSLDFLQHTPALVKLKIYKRGVNDDYYDDGSEDEAARLFGDMVLNSKLLMNSPDFTVPSMKEFRTDRNMVLGSLNTLKKWMPNLEIMETPISE